MADPVVVSRLGQENGQGDAWKLFINHNETEILKYFKLTALIKDKITVKSLPDGKSISFPVVGNTAAEYHQVGKQLDGKKILHSERKIELDSMLVAHAYIDDLDKAMSHYNSESAYSERIGRALGKKYEQDALRTLVKAAAISNTAQAAAYGLPAFDDQPYSSNVIVQSADKNDGFKIYEAILEAKRKWEDNENLGEPCLILQSEQYYRILANPATTGTTFVDDAASQSGKVPMIAGCKVFTSPYLPKDNVQASASVMSKYAGNFTGTIGVLFSKEAMGAAELINVNIRVDYIPDRLAHLMVGKMAVGFGILNPASAILIAEAGSAVLNIFNSSVASISVEPSTATLDVSEGETLDPVVKALMTNGQEVEVTEGFSLVSSDPTKASVSGTTITAVAAGSATITATFMGKTSTCVVTVVS